MGNDKEMEIAEFRAAVKEVLPKGWKVSVIETEYDVEDDIDYLGYTITATTGYKYRISISMTDLLAENDPFATLVDSIRKEVKTVTAAEERARLTGKISDLAGLIISN